VLVRVYARCVTGLEDVWTGRMDNALHLGADDVGGVLRTGTRHPVARRVRECRAFGVPAGQDPISAAQESAPVGFEPTLTAPEAANAIVRISSLTCVTFSAARRYLTDHSVNIPDHAVQGSCAGSS
jgi:hypothetical protein